MKFKDEELRQSLGMPKARGVKPGTKRAPYDTKKIETVTINFRVPKEQATACKDYLRPILRDFLTPLTNNLT